MNNSRIIRKDHSWIFFLLILFCNKSLSQLSSLRDIKVKSVSNSISTIVNIGCTEFDSAFSPEEMKEKIITDSSILKSFEQVLGKVKYRKVSVGINVRSKFYLRFMDSKENPIIICMDKFDDIEVNDQQIKKNKKLIELLHKIKGPAA